MATHRKFFPLFWALVWGLCAIASEKDERKVDRLARTLQKDMIAKLSSLVKKHEGKKDQASLTLRLLEAHQAAAQIEFRLSHYDSDKNKTKIDTSAYDKCQEAVIETANLFQKKFVDHPQLDQVVFARAQSYEELKKKTQAKADYEYVAEKFPSTSFAIRSNLALGALATADNNHAAALGYLKRILPFKEDSHYPFALYQLAWSSYNLKDYDGGLGYLKLYVGTYQSKARAQEGMLSTSDQAYYEHGLRDVVTFFADGFEKKQEGYGIGDAFPVFSRYEPGAFLGKMLVSFAKHLRSRKLIAELKEWKQLVLKKQGDRPEALEIVMLDFDRKIIEGGYEKVPEAMEDVLYLNGKVEGGIKKWESFPGAVAYILKTATEIQKKIGETQRPTEITMLTASFRAIVEAYKKIGDETDPKLAQLHFNYAETLFKLKKYEESTSAYLWVRDHWSEKTGLKLSDVTLRVVGSRYQTLLEKDEIPKALGVAELKGEEEVDLGKLSALSREWIVWLDAYVKNFGRGLPEVENFEYEANRLLYFQGQQKAAVRRMTKSVLQNPKSKFVLPAASLVLDTFLFNKEWEKAQATAETFSQNADLGDAAFRARLAKIPDDTAFKLVERAYEAKDFQKSLELSEVYLEKHKQSAHLPACLFLASRSAHNTGNEEKAGFFLNELLTRYPKDENRSVALLASASIKEAKHDFDGATRDYREYFGSHSTQESSDILKRYWISNWLSKKPSHLDCGGVTESLRSECEKYEALNFLSLGESPEASHTKKALSGPAENRTLWASVFLHKGKKLSLKTQLELTSVLIKNWKELDPLLQFSMLPIINQDLPRVFRESRAGLGKAAPLKSNSSSITRRIKLIQEIETLAGNAVAMPWGQVKLTSLQEMAGIYLDFAEELSKLPIPKDITPEEKADYEKSVAELVVPFREKGTLIKKQADEIKTHLESTRTPAAAGNEEKGPTLDLLEKNEDPSLKKAAPLRVLWQEALTQNQWQRVAYFFQQLKETAGLGEATLGLMRAITLETAGAHPEAQAEMAGLRNPTNQGVTP